MIERALLVALAAAGTLLFPAPLGAQGLSQRLDLEQRRARFDMPGRLSEISGLAFGPGDELFAHGDERGRVFRIDLEDGSVDEGFWVGDPPVREDFEGMAVVGNRFFLVASGGLLYEFRAAPAGATTPVRVTDTGVGRACEVEGLAYHPGTDALLLACKTVFPAAEEIRIHRLPLAPDAPSLPPIRVPFEAFAARGHDGPVHPSAVEVDPSTGTLLLLAARQELLFEVDLTGALLDLVPLRRRRHPQPEGLAIGTDGRLYIGDEANGGDARLTVYGPHRKGGA